MNNNDFFTFETGQATDVGCVRSVNEDSFLSRPDCGLWAVADGMGGHSAGDFASQTVVAQLNSIGVAASPEDLRARVVERLAHANEIILNHADEIESGTIGATVAALLVHETQFACLWSGDSRIYLLRDGVLSQQSRDHTEVRALLDAGTISEEEARTWPRKNVITQAIGVAEEVAWELVSGELALGDVFLICSDGLTEHIEDDEIAEALRNHPPQEACAALVAETIARGARDNVTVVAMRCAGPPPPATDEMLIEREGTPEGSA